MTELSWADGVGHVVEVVTASGTKYVLDLRDSEIKTLVRSNGVAADAMRCDDDQIYLVGFGRDLVVGRGAVFTLRLPDELAQIDEGEVYLVTVRETTTVTEISVL